MMKPQEVSYAVRRLAPDHGFAAATDGNGLCARIATDWDGIEFFVERGNEVIMGRVSAEEHHRGGYSKQAMVELIDAELARLAKEPRRAPDLRSVP